jgi:hypothetical protein
MTSSFLTSVWSRAPHFIVIDFWCMTSSPLLSPVRSRAPRFIVNHLVHELQFLDICLVQGPPNLLSIIWYMTSSFLTSVRSRAPPVYSQPFGTRPPGSCHLFGPGPPILLATIWYITSNLLSSVQSRAPQFIVNHLVHDLQFLDIFGPGPPHLLSTIWNMTSNLLSSVRSRTHPTYCQPFGTWPPISWHLWSRAPPFIVNHLVHYFQFLVICLVQGPQI